MTEQPPPCENHTELQHLDGNPPFCHECGWTHGEHREARKIVGGKTLGVLTGQVRMKPEFPECDGHKEVQHRDGLPPWCRKCGWNRGRFTRTPMKVKDV